MNKADLSDLPASIKPEDTEAYLAKVAHMTGSNLPAIIDAPGEYITRSGQRAVIDRIDSPEKATANCKGTLYFPPKKPGGKEKTDYQIWQPNGRFNFLNESMFDIVEKAK